MAARRCFGCWVALCGGGFAVGVAVTRSVDLPREARAFLDAVAVGESGGADDDAAYSVVFGGGHFGLPWPPGFPEWGGVRVGDSMTHAAGRYQFEPATWRGLGGGSFDPENQDGRAWQLAGEVKPALLARLVSDSLDGLATALQSTWTSLSEDTFPERYRAALEKIG